MKVCILSTCTQRHMILVSTYQKYFKERSIEYDFIYPDKFHVEELSSANNTYRYEVSNSNNFLVKAIDYLKFIRYSKKILLQNCYDLIIVWNEATAALFSDFLVKKFKNKYIVVVLDLFNENDKLKNEKILTSRLNKAIECSIFSTVSSPGYIKYLSTKKEYLFVDNINNAILPREAVYSVSNKKPIVILYSGNISYPDLAKKMLLRFKNDNRFFIKIIGSGSEKLIDFVIKNNISNVEIRGKFDSKDTLNILKEGDIIYNVYDNKYHCEQTALSNKLYYAVCLNIPILVSPKTYMEEVTKELGIGYTIDFDDKNDICTDLYNWSLKFDQNKTRDKCISFKNDAFSSHLKLYEKLDEIFSEMK